MRNFAVLCFRFLPVFLFTIPVFANARSLNDILAEGGGYVQYLAAILVLLAVIFFFYGVVQYFFVTQDVTEKKKGISMMIFGLVGLFVIVSVWGLVAILQHTFGVADSGSVEVYGSPSVNESGG